MNNLRKIAPADQYLGNPKLKKIEKEFGHQLVLETLRAVLDEVRNDPVSEDVSSSEEKIIQRVTNKIYELSRRTLVPVINATGVILHTNLGRAPLSDLAIQSMNEVAQGYSTLEYDLVEGSRGSRSDHVRDILVRLTGAEDAFVVNNNAAAVLLCLTSLARDKRVVISRSQLIEIGGGFRVPDVMRQSGAKLVEVGTTNKVRLADYEDALRGGAEVVMAAHHSNFKITGFTEEPEISDLIQHTHNAEAVFIYDLGSGALVDTSRYGLMKEPMVQDAVQEGADLVCFSGDKLLGGPQAGIIVGKREFILKLKKHPLARAARIDKLCLAALATTLLAYLKGKWETDIPLWRMVSMPVEEIHFRAVQWKNTLGVGEVIEGESAIGGGSLPQETLPTFLFALDVRQPNHFLLLLRESNPPVIARIQDGKVVFDPRTVANKEESIFLKNVKTELQRRNL
jgi:L-seryl-tRNA(Ser) seleniumtransferase